jgi:Caspase domain
LDKLNKWLPKVLPFGVITISLILFQATELSAADHNRYAIIIGSNSGFETLAPLNYADDDAYKFYRFINMFVPTANIYLLTEFDEGTTADFSVLPVSYPPYKDIVLNRIAKIAERIDQTDGQATVYIYFSGHGIGGSLVLKGRGLERPEEALLAGRDLREALAALPHNAIKHVFIDACQARSILQSRGGDSALELGPDFSEKIRSIEELAWLPRTGVLGASVAKTYEDRRIKGGTFSHVLLSGLAGAADLDSDGIISYGDMGAYLSIYTQQKYNAGGPPTADTIFEPPSEALDEPIIDLSEINSGVIFPVGSFGHFLFLERNTDKILLEFHKERQSYMRIILPPAVYKLARVDSPERVSVGLIAANGAPVVFKESLFQDVIELNSSGVRGEGLPTGSITSFRDFDPRHSPFRLPYSFEHRRMFEFAWNTALARNDGSRFAERAQIKAEQSPISTLSIGPSVASGYLYNHRLLAGSQATYQYYNGRHLFFGFKSATLLATSGIPFGDLSFSGIIGYYLFLPRLISFDIGFAPGYARIAGDNDEQFRDNMALALEYFAGFRKNIDSLSLAAYISHRQIMTSFDGPEKFNDSTAGSITIGINY